jgi:DNA-binding response OmpR family regulator
MTGVPAERPPLRGVDLPQGWVFADEAAEETGHEEQGMTHRILIVEDDFLVRLTLSEALVSDGFDVVEAETAEEALQMLQSDPTIGLLMTDMQLGGGLNGQELAIATRARRADLPVIFMTGRPDLVHGFGTGKERIVTKPYLPSAICAAARELIAMET